MHTGIRQKRGGHIHYRVPQNPQRNQAEEGRNGKGSVQGKGQCRIKQVRGRTIFKLRGPLQNKTDPYHCLIQKSFCK